MPTSILVTGGAGYIGSHACKRLAQAGYRPVVLDNLCLGHEEFVRWGPLVRGDTHDSDLVRRTIEEHRIAAVMHFAAFAYVGESTENPSKYYHNNVGGTLGLLDGMRAAGCNKLVFSSTCAVYGQPEALPISEATPLRPVNPYGASKAICETIIRDFTEAYDLSAVALRYFNASGADPEGDLGEKREIETHIIPRAMMALQGYVDDFQVFGSDFPTKDGTAVRDYIHVVDLALAHIGALSTLLGGRTGFSAFNLGTGEGYTVADLLQTIGRIAGRPLPAARGGRRPGDPAELVADASRARAEIGFDPVYSDLETIVGTAWRWHLHAHPRRNDPAETSE